MHKLSLVAGISLVAGSMLLCQVATAQTAPVALSPDQIASFADVVGDSEDTVVGRLQLDRNLVPLAAAAADARQSRKRTGKILAITGFTLLGVGDIVGAAIIVSTPGYPNVGDSGWTQVGIGAAVALGSLAVGLAIGIPGVVKMAAYSDAENEAVLYYEQRRFNGPPPQTTPGLTSKALTTPIVSFAF